MRKYLPMLLLLLLVLQFVAADPPEPPALPDLQGLLNTPVVMITGPSADATVNLTSVIQYRNLGLSALTCTLYLDGVVVGGATFIGDHNVTVTMTEGTHQTWATCILLGRNVSSSPVLFHAVASGSTYSSDGSVVFISPLENATPTLNITFNQSMSGSVSCRIYSNGLLLQQLDNPPSSVPVTVQFQNAFAEGLRRFDINCSNSTSTGSATGILDLEYPAVETGDLLISPLLALTQQTVTISGTLGVDAAVEVHILTPLGYTDVVQVNTTDGSFSADYVVAPNGEPGTYDVSIYVNGQRQSLQGSFVVVQHLPLISLTGGTTIAAGLPITVLGQQFSANDSISLKLTGGGSVDNAVVETDSDGSFTYEYPSTFAPQSYTLIARSQSESSIVASINFNIEQGSIPTVNAQNPNTVSSHTGPPGTVQNTVPKTDPTTPTTTITPPNQEKPAVVDSGTGSSWLWWIIPLFLIVLFGGLVGYLVSTGSLNISSPEAFQRSVTALFNGSHTSKPESHSTLGVGQSATVKSFIVSERSKGFDDLTIRNALIAKGWTGNDIDKVFDDIYAGK